jgi:phosphotransferase system HPr-like phosphotransfer protein
MFTATLHIPEEKANALRSRIRFLKDYNRFQSIVTIQRGNSKPLDISIDEHLKELAANESEDIRIVIEGRDEMKAACRFVDFFNHGIDL